MTRDCLNVSTNSDLIVMMMMLTSLMGNSELEKRQFTAIRVRPMFILLCGLAVVVSGCLLLLGGHYCFGPLCLSVSPQ